MPAADDSDWRMSGLLKAREIQQRDQVMRGEAVGRWIESTIECEGFRLQFLFKLFIGGLGDEFAPGQIGDDIFGHGEFLIFAPRTQQDRSNCLRTKI